MNFIKNWFNTEIESRSPNLVFGRYSDAYKSKKQYEAWDEAQKSFDNGQMLEGGSKFLTYLKDEHHPNVIWEHKQGHLAFQYYQGSKLISGYMANGKVRATARIAKATNAQVGLLRKLLEENYDLRYSRYALTDENEVCLVFDSWWDDINNYKLYYALKELGLKSDKQDDLLLDEFKDLAPVDNGHIAPIPEKEFLVKYNLAQSIINEMTLEQESFGNSNNAHATRSYKILNAVYTMDYLLRPEGVLMEKIEQIHTLYAQNQDASKLEENNHKAQSILSDLKDQSEEQYRKEFYQVMATFGVTKAVNIEEIAHLIRGQLANIQWFIGQGQHEGAIDLIGFIIGSSLFKFAPPAPVKELMHLYYRVIYPDFFKALGFESVVLNNGQINDKIVRQYLEQIEVAGQDKEDQMVFDPQLLHFTRPADFGLSLLNMILMTKPGGR